MLTACSLAYLENDTDKDTISTSGKKVSNESKNNTENTEKTGEQKGTDESSLKEKCHSYYYELFEDYTKPFLNIEGEMYYGMYSEKGALIWRWKDATFTEEGRYELAFAIDTETFDCFDEVRYEGKKISKNELKNLLKKNGWDGIAYSGFQSFEEFEPELLVNCGDDIFGVRRYRNNKSRGPEETMFNALYLGQLKETATPTPTPKKLMGPTPTPKPGVPTNTPTPTPTNTPTQTPSGNKYFVKCAKGFNRITDFSDGYAWFVDRNSKADPYDDYIVLYLCFKDLEADGYVGDHSYDKALYIERYFEKRLEGIDVDEYDAVQLSNESENMIFFRGRFVDMTNDTFFYPSEVGLGEVYIKQGVYVPKFENGVCELITMKNDKYWVMHIDRTGNLLDEPVEIQDYEIIKYANSKTFVNY